jgi:monoamine oxidase
LGRALEDGMSYCWEEDPWARGAFPQPRPGKLIQSLSILRKPIGRLVFAGDYASAWPGWMQGALESGNHAARTIDAAL